MNTATIDNLAQEIPAWKRSGLPGRPYYCIGNDLREMEDPSKLLSDPHGKVIYAHNSPATVKKAYELRFSGTFLVVAFGTDESTIPECSTSSKWWDAMSKNAYAFVQTDGDSLTVPEREAAAAMAWMGDIFNFTSQRQPAYLIPEVFSSVAASNPAGYVGIPWKALTEEKAFQLAIYIERRFDTTTQVIKSDGGYYVSATACEDLEANLHELEYVAWLLEDFDLVPSVNWRNFCSPDEQDLHIEVLSNRIVNLVRHQEHTANQLDAILAALSGTSPNNAIGAGGKHDRDAHHLSAKPARKTRIKK